MSSLRDGILGQWPRIPGRISAIPCDSATSVCRLGRFGRGASYDIMYSIRIREFGKEHARIMTVTESSDSSSPSEDQRFAEQPLESCPRWALLTAIPYPLLALGFPLKHPLAH